MTGHLNFGLSVWVFGLVTSPLGSDNQNCFFWALSAFCVSFLVYFMCLMSVQEMSPGVYSAMGSVMEVSMDSPSSARPPTKSPMASVMESYS